MFFLRYGIFYGMELKYHTGKIPYCKKTIPLKYHTVPTPYRLLRSDTMLILVQIGWKVLFGISWSIQNCAYCEREVPCLVVGTPYNTFYCLSQALENFFNFCLVFIAYNEFLVEGLDLKRQSWYQIRAFELLYIICFRIC